jgi:hypothetical protein
MRSSRRHKPPQITIGRGGSGEIVALTAERSRRGDAHSQSMQTEDPSGSISPYTVPLRMPCY